ncbi:hypothetical protein PNA55_12210, partial [Enterococcus faecium]|nr:hypothetical protein [Enterococcus faecium]
MQKNLRIRKLQQKNLRIFPFFERKIKNGTDYVYIHNGSILFDVGELHQHLFCIKKYRKDTL